jgi:predicted amidophosphoribosyltransferase
MTRATLKIVTQRMSKLEQLIHFIFGEIFGVSTDYHSAILRLWHAQGIYYYRPFRTGHIATLSLLPYRHKPIRYAIYQMKFRNKRSYIPLLGSLIADVLVDMLAELEDTHNFSEPLLLMVPSRHSQVTKRGAHITYELARSAVEQGLHQWVDFQPSLLRQTREITKQSRLANRKERLNNPRGAYRVTKPDRIACRNIIVLDDVYTTGATLDEITRLLEKAGARRIIRITVAH